MAIPSRGAPSVIELEQLLADRKTPEADREVVVATAAPAEVDRRILGPEQAPLTLTWYTDVRSSLAPAQAKLIHTLADRYGAKLRVLFKAFPLATHPDSTLAAAALIAAQQQDGFWPMFDALSAHPAALTREDAVAMATSLKLDPNRFTNALDDATAAAQQDVAAAQRRGILGAPVIFLNDKRCRRPAARGLLHRHRRHGAQSVASPPGQSCSVANGDPLTSRFDH